MNNCDFQTLRGCKSDLGTKYYWERVQKHRITLGIQYHGLGTSIGTYIIGNANIYVKKFKKDQTTHFSDLSGGVLVALLHSGIIGGNVNVFENNP